MKQIIVIAVSVLFFNLTLISSAPAINQAYNPGNRTYPVEIRSTPEKDMLTSAKTGETGFFSKYKWWILGSIAVIGGVAAGASGSSGGGDSAQPTPHDKDTGSAMIRW